MSSLQTANQNKSNPSPYLFGIYADDPNFPCASIIRTHDGFKLQTTDCSVSHLKTFSKQAVDDWMQKYFPTLIDEYTAWQSQGSALDNDNELIPVATICATTKKIVARYKNITVYAELDDDNYHFTFGANKWDQEKSAPQYCEFSLRHVYIIDKAIPVLHEHIGIDDNLKPGLEEKINLIKSWLSGQHEKPPAPIVNADAGTPAKPKKVKPPLNAIITKDGETIPVIITQSEYDAIQEQINDPIQSNYEWEHRNNCGMDWIVAENGQLFVLYYGGNPKNILGSGGFSEVRFAQEIETGLWYAVKVQETIKMANEKIDIEEYLLSKQNLFYTSARIDEKGIRLSFEKILKAKPISALIRPNPQKSFESVSNEDRYKITISVIESLLLSIKSLHQSGYLHRDIKMENILYNAEDHKATLIDFGSVEREDKAGILVVDCHEVHPVTTNNYNAPELVEARELNKKRFVYDELTDMYAAGKVIGELVANYEGFDLQHYREDILGPIDNEDLSKKEKYIRYTNHWIKKFMPDCPIQLKASDFFDDDLNSYYPYATAHNHSSLRFILEYAKKYPHKKDIQSQLWIFGAKCLAQDRKDRLTIDQALAEIECIKKLL